MVVGSVVGSVVGWVVGSVVAAYRATPVNITATRSLRSSRPAWASVSAPARPAVPVALTAKLARVPRRWASSTVASAATTGHPPVSSVARTTAR